MPFHFGHTHITAHTESGTHIAECTFKVTVNDKQRPKVDGRVYRCMDMDSSKVEPFGVCDGPKPVITKDADFPDTHHYTTDRLEHVSKACCQDAHGADFECSEGGEGWGFKYCLPI